MLKPRTNQFIGAWTSGLMDMPSSVREAIEKEFNRQIREIDDHFYTIVVCNARFFVVENGEFGYTAMLPDEY